MKQFRIKPVVKQFAKVDDFISEYPLGEGDLIFVSGSTYENYFKDKTGNAVVINYRKYGSGEPTDLMVEGICKDIEGISYKRVIAIGGGTILDVAKLFTLKQVSPVVDLFERNIPLEREKELLLIPTTCGTGSEITNVSILELTVRNTKFGLADDSLFADEAILIPELLENLPFKFYATSSIDALIHAVESFTSPKATAFSKMYSTEAIKIILDVYKKIAKEGPEVRLEYLDEMLTASTYAGIAFGNAGTGAVHAMSYPFGAAYHVPHGEANYAIFTGVYKKYMSIKTTGSIAELNMLFASILECDVKDVYEAIEELLNHILQKKPLSAYGVKEDELPEFSKVVVEKQGRLTANNFVPLDFDDYLEIYKTLYR